MKKFITKYKRQGESGNVLFLILIAVALFAALSYAVTQSSRGGSGDAGGEASLVNSAQITQYPASVRTSLIRMMINGKATADQLEFDPPADFASLNSTDFGVFHPSGGGAIFGAVPPDIMFTSVKGTWLFSSMFQINEIGLTTPPATGNAGNDIIAFLPNMSLAVCRKLNEELGILAPFVNDADTNGVPGAGVVIANVPVAAMNMSASIPNIGIGAYDAAREIGIAGAGADFTGQPFGCADFNEAGPGTAAGDLVYFHVLIER